MSTSVYQVCVCVIRRGARWMGTCRKVTLRLRHIISLAASLGSACLASYIIYWHAETLVEIWCLQDRHYIACYKVSRGSTVWLPIQSITNSANQPRRCRDSTDTDMVACEYTVALSSASCRVWTFFFLLLVFLRFWYSSSPCRWHTAMVWVLLFSDREN